MATDRCPVCGKGKLHEELGEFRTDFISDDGKHRDVIVPQIKKLVCGQCGEYILDPESESRISAAQRHAMGLLGAEELMRLRNSLGKSQEGMAELLGLGKKTWCRWESDDYFQSEAFDRYLRLLVFVPSNVEALKLIDKEKRDGKTDLSRTFRYVPDARSTEVLARQFLPVLMDGPFN
jgi:putative zinc finger/helix-turn-helix YgiT family protein